MDLAFAFVIPLRVISSVLSALNTTTKDDGQAYWHIHISEPEAGKFGMLLPKRSETLPLGSYRVSLA
jgi:hypothetical protein